MKAIRALAIVAILCATATAARPLKQSTATTIIVGPFLSATDGITPQTALTVGNIDCDLYKNGGSKTDVTLTATGGSNDCAHVANGYYSLELTATDTGTAGYLRISMNISGAIPYFEDIEIKSANPYDSEYSTAIRAANVTQLGGATQSATDLKHFADSGYNPATSFVTGATTANSIGAGGIVTTSFGTGAINAAAIANGAMTKGAEIAGFNDISTTQVRTEVDGGLTGFWTSPQTQADLGAVSVWDRVLSRQNHNISLSAGRRLRNLQDFGLYAEASVWVDEANGASLGTEDFEDATVTNRANDFDNAQTVATSVTLDKIHVQNGNVITLTAPLNGFNLWGGGYELNLNGQDLTETSIENASLTGTGTGTLVRFKECTLGPTTIPPCWMKDCDWRDVTTIQAVGDYIFTDCASRIPGEGEPTLDMGAAIGATQVSFRRWSGGISIINMQLGDEVSVDAVSGSTVSVNGTGGTLDVAGMVAVSDLSGGAVTITQTQVINQPALKVNAQQALSDYDSPNNTQLNARTLPSAQYSTLTGSDTIGLNFGNVVGILQSANVANDILGQSPPANWSGLSISAGNVNAMVQGYLATAITETNAGDIARSLGFFYNVTPTTIKTVNDVGGGAGGGEADWTTTERSQIREALGVTGTTLATTGSGHLDGVKVKTDPLTFTKPTELDVNIKSINQIEIIGAGRNPPFGVPP